MTEDDQLELLAAEYRARGYDVTVHPKTWEWIIPDMVAHGRSADGSADRIVVEIANLRPAEETIMRARQLSEILQGNPGWRVEFRFLQITPAVLRSRLAPIDLEQAHAALSSFLEDHNHLDDAVGATLTAVSMWWLWTRTWRALAQASSSLNETDDLADLIADLIVQGLIQDPPFRYLDGVLPYARLHQIMQAVLEGEVVELAAVAALNWHLRQLNELLHNRTFLRDLGIESGPTLQR